MAVSSIAQKNVADTSVGKWNGVWDPADPNCPCYNIQKQAEKEYQEMLKKEQKDEEQVKNNIDKDSSPLTDKKLIYESDTSGKQNLLIKNNRTDNTSDVRGIKHKSDKKRKKSRERKYKKGKSVCPDI